MSPPSTLIASYRALYKAALAAVQHSSPARYAVRDKLRSAFRSRGVFVPQRADNTVAFLRTAAWRKGLEHQVVRNLCMVHYWQVMGKKRYVSVAVGGAGGWGLTVVKSPRGGL